MFLLKHEWKHEMEFILVGLAMILILLVAKNGSSKQVSKPTNDNEDEDTIYG